ncbi:choice-of-anchor P family protein [Prauserella oleivorans]
MLNAEASNGYAKASVAEAEVALGNGLPTIGLELISAECDNLQGSTSLATLKVGDRTVALDQLPENTAVIPKPLQGVASITLNKQVKTDDALTVTALSIDVLNSTQTIDIASATCTEKDAEPTESTQPTEPSEPSDPTTPPDNGDGGDDDGDDDMPGTRPDEDGKAPTPVPQPGHLDVTG